MHQLFQDVELDGGHFNAPAIAENLARAGIERHAVDLNSAAGGPGLQPPKNRPDARHQFSGVERFWQIVVGAQLESDDSIYVFAARSQHQYRDTTLLPQ